jgi:prepilin-type N-terminal cleavage/methylation domain-containing protein
MARGFSLLEVMIATTLLGVGVAATLASVDAVRVVAQRSRHMTQAVHVAESVAESMLALEQADDDLDAGAHINPPRRFDAVGQEVDPGDTTRGIYIVTWDVFANTPIEGLRRVTITVDWETVDGAGFTTLTFHRR